MRWIGCTLRRSLLLSCWCGGRWWLGGCSRRRFSPAALLTPRREHARRRRPVPNVVTAPNQRCRSGIGHPCDATPLGSTVLGQGRQFQISARSSIGGTAGHYLNFVQIPAGPRFCCWAVECRTTSHRDSRWTCCQPSGGFGEMRSAGKDAGMRSVSSARRTETPQMAALAAGWKKWRAVFQRTSVCAYPALSLC